VSANSIALSALGAERERLAGYVRETIDGCLAHQRPDGLFHDVLDDPYKVDAEGYVRGVCGSPTFDRPGTATEGQAFCLLMEAARAG